MASPSPQAPAPSGTARPADERERPADATKPWIAALRDVAILAAALSIFAAADTWSLLTRTTLASALSLVDGLLVGVVFAGLLHEWGHFIGARVTGGSAPLRPVLGFLPLFDFDYEGNTQAQFRGMGIGGNVAHWLAVLVLLVGLPLETLGQVALASSAFGFAVFGSSIEVPVIRDSYQGASSLEALGRIPKDFVKRNGTYGLIAAGVAFLVL